MKMLRKQPSNKPLRIIRNVYLYLVAMIGIVVFVIGSVGLINNVLQHYVFQVNQNIYSRSPLGYWDCSETALAPPVVDKSGEIISPAPTREVTEEEITECEAKYDAYNKTTSDNEAKREFAISIAQIVVGLPLWLWHWGIIQREYRRRKKEDKK